MGTMALCTVPVLVGDGSGFRYGKVDTIISCLCIVGSAQCSGCVVYSPSAMAAI